MDSVKKNPENFDVELYGKPSLPSEGGQAGLQPVPDDHKPTGAEKKPTIAQILLEIAEREAVLFQDHHGKAWARIRGRCWPVRSKNFRRFLQREYYHTTGKPPGGQAFSDAIDQIEGKAMFETYLKPREVHVRSSYQSGKIFIHLADEANTVIEVSANGWNLGTTETTYFWRPSSLLELPIPEKGGCIDLLKPFLNYGEERDFRLMIAWILAALNPSIPCPAINLQGEQGSAKTTQSKVLRLLTDPNGAPVRSAPGDERDLVIQANNSRVICLDNLSGMKPWLSDALCRIITGSGFSTRKLYSDNEEQIFHAQRPVILNGIDDIATRGDLLDRSIVLSLPAIPKGQRKDERLYWKEFHEVRPLIFGALLDAVSYGLSNPVKLDSLPRMADFAEWVTSCEGAFGWEPGTIVNDYNENRGKAVETGLDSDILASAIRKILKDRSEVRYAATELIAKIEIISGDVNKRYLPTTRTLKDRMTRLSPALRQIGITWVRTRTESGTTYELRKTPINVQDVQVQQESKGNNRLENGTALAERIDNDESARNLRTSNSKSDNRYCSTGRTGRTQKISLHDQKRREFLEAEGYSADGEAPF